MKKEIIICFVVIAIVVILSTVTERHTDYIMNGIEGSLNDLRGDLISENEEKVNIEISEVFKKWQEEKDMLAIYIEHDELEKIETYLTEINSNIETKEYSIAVESLDTCNFIMEHIKDKYKFSLKNIF